MNTEIESVKSRLTALEREMFDDGWVRDPNCFERWYASCAGKLEPVFPLQLRVSDKVWLVTRRYGHGETEFIPLMAFSGPKSLNEYLSRNGKKAEALAPYSNSQD